MNNPFAGIDVVVVRSDGDSHEFTVSEDSATVSEQTKEALDFLNDKVKIISYED